MLLQWTADLYNVDDVGEVYVNSNLVLRVLYKKVGRVVLTPSFLQGMNAVRLTFSNTGGGWSYGYRFALDGKPFLQSQCGDVGRWGCQNDDQHTGIVHEAILNINHATVSGTVPILRQIGDTCWATTATMLISWKEGRSLSPEDVVARAGSAYTALYQHRNVLPFGVADAFFSSLHFLAEPPKDYTFEGWAELIRMYGPLWVTTARTPTHPRSVHAFVMVGATSDGSADRSFVSLIDPATGTQRTQRFADFATAFDNMARAELGAGADLAPQVLHF